MEQININFFKNSKISIIDISLIAILIFAVIFLVYKLSNRGIVETAPQTQTIALEFYSEQFPDYVFEGIEEGQNLYDDTRNIYLGKVKSFETTNGFKYSPDEFGNLVKSNKENYLSIIIVAEVSAEIISNGFRVNGTRYEIGHPFRARVGKSLIDGRLKSFG